MSADERPRFCAFCGLPLPRTLDLGHRRSDTEIEYCCSGCRTVASVEEAEHERGASAHGLMQLGLAIFFTMNVMVFTMALWSQDVYPAESFTSSLAVTLRSVFRWASLVFSLPVLWLLGGPITQGVWQALRRRAVTTDLLILLGVSAAYGYSVISVLRGEGHVYFEVGSMVLVFVSIGRWLEAKGKRRTGESLDQLADLLPVTVRRLDLVGDFREASREEVVTGDVVRVLAGERFPVDGRIVEGEAHVDQQMVTGESQPVEKRPGDAVCSGTLNVDGDLRVEVTAGDGRETVSRLIEMVRTARSAKGLQERLADRIALWFIPTVCLIAIVAAWFQGRSHSVDQGILTGLAVVLIACPCALGLATPMAVWTALGRAAQCGVLFRSGLVMERLASVKIACFDKTGTLTTGNSTVAVVLVADEQSPHDIVSAAAEVAAGSTHPLSQAIVNYAKEQFGDRADRATSSVVNVLGKGLRTEINGKGNVLIGSQRLMDETQLQWPVELLDELAAHEATQRVFVGWGGQVRGAFCFSEALRGETTEALAACRQLDLDLRLLTGDGVSCAEALSTQLALVAKSDQLPEDKVAAIRELAERGSVAMIGDGLNDAPALAAADVGVALGCGADVSRDAAGVCLLADDLRRFPWAVGLARMTGRVVKQNLFWAFTYNCIGIALATTGRLNPIWAALAMAVSSLLVVVNSLRLGRYPDSLPMYGDANELAAESSARLPRPDDATFASTTTNRLAASS